MITTLNGFFSQGTNAERLAYTPDPSTPAVGPKPNVMWQETDTGDLYYWDFDTAAWVSTNPGGSVSSVSVASANGFAGSVADPTTTPAITLSTSVTGILKGNGTAISAAVAGDFPTLNQNTTGSAATLTTPRAIYGNNFDGSAALTQVIASTFGGTGNGFTKFSGPTTAEKTFTLPDANATLAIASATLTADQVVVGNGTAAVKVLAAGTDTHVLTMVGGVPAWAASSGGGTPGGSTTQLQYNNAGAFGGISGATFSGGVLTLPDHTVTKTSGLVTLKILGASTAPVRILFAPNNDAPAVIAVGAAGATNDIITGSAVGDLALSVNGNNQRILFNTINAGGIGFGLETANGGISWGGSTSGTVPVKSSLTVFPASGNATLTLQATTSATVWIAFKANNDGYAGCSLGQAAAVNHFITGSAAGDICMAINGNSQRFIVGTALSAIGFGVAANNAGIFTVAPAGASAHNWLLGSVVAGAVSLDATQSVFVAINGTVRKLLIAA